VKSFSTFKAMKFSAVFTSLVVIIPLLSGQPVVAGNNNAAGKNNNTNNNNGKNNNGNNNNGNPQTSLELDSAVLCTSCASNGLTSAEPGEEASQTSTNNYINFCLPTLSTLPITNGIQPPGGTCNPIPMGQIPAASQVPAVAFTSPLDGSTIPANTPFNATLKVLNIDMGHFTNATSTYLAAPQTLNNAGQVKGHSHVAIQETGGSTDPQNPAKFAFFKGLNSPVDGNNELTAVVSAGLPDGIYRICSITTSANHASIVAGQAQRGLTDDCIHITVSGAGGNAGNATNSNNSTTGKTGNVDSSVTGKTGNNTVTASGNNTVTATGNNATASGNNATKANSGNVGNAAKGNSGNVGNAAKNNKNNNAKGGNQRQQGGKNGRKGQGGRRAFALARLARER
jgi:hypothetical protein